MASTNTPPEIPPRRHSSTISPNKIINQSSAAESKSPSFLSRRHSSCIDDNMDSETDTYVFGALNTTAALIPTTSLVKSTVKLGTVIDLFDVGHEWFGAGFGQPGGSYNYGYNLNDASTGELQEQRETKVCNDQVVYDDNIKPTILASKSFVAEPIIASVTSGPIMNTEFVSSTPASILRSDFESSRIVAAAPLLETKIEAEPLIYAPRPKYASPITVTAAPMLETKIVAEPLAYAARAEYAPLVKYAPRPEYLAASPAPLIMSKPQTPIVHVQAPTQIIKSAQLQSYGRLSTSHSHKSFVNHPQAPLKIAAVAAPQYYAAAPAAPEYYAPTVVAKEYHVAAPAAPEYHSAAPIAWQAAPAPIAVKIANPVVQANYGKIALQQAAVPLFAPSTQYAYRSSSPAKSYQYASQWKNYEQLAASQLHYSAASPQYYSTVYQPQFDYATAEQPCE